MIEKEKYKEYISKTCPKSSHWKTLLTAFLVGGTICVVGEALKDLYSYLLPSFEKKMVLSLVTITMIFLGAFFTGIGWYDKLGKYAGAGSIVPITGFANSIVSPAMEFNKEGIFYGIMAKMFIISGPIIVSGVSASVLVGIIYYIVGVV